uniref:hypothetical protein n=1 Tax=Agathobacter sp. TaxID=2021311 RepID=UPI004056AFCD
MALDSYRLTRQCSYSNPRKEMLREKKIQVHSLYELSMDREDDTLLNGKNFVKSPRIFDHKLVDSVHHKITVETIHENDWMECGDYLEYDNMIWLCLNSYSFHNLYCHATFMSCDWQIYWINENGELKSQYVIDQNNTQYNSGESGNNTMTLGAAQHMLKMPYNEDTIMLDSPQRFAIDKNTKKPTCYKVTQNGNTSYNYGKGLCCLTVAETQLNLEKDKLITLENGKQVWICDYIRPKADIPSTLPSNPTSPNETTIPKATITGKDVLKIGHSRTYTVEFTDKSGNVLDWNTIGFVWNVASDVEIGQAVVGNTIELFVNDETLVEESFVLSVIMGNTIVAEMEVKIEEGF